MENQKILKFLEHFSIITVSDNKIPNFAWKQQQSEKLSKEKFLSNYNYKGGYIKQDGTERPATTNFGIVTGFEFLEVLDIDLKVFSTALEQKEFWNEYLQNLKDNILDFEEKFSIYKTKNAGYHILYKTKRVEGNLKLAKLKGHKEAILETRGNGGYVFAYPENHYLGKKYFEIDFISDDDREILMSFSKMYDYIEEVKFIPEKKISTQFEQGEKKPWDDYNEKTNVWDLIQNEFTIPKNGVKQKFTLVKRHGATSPHSGSIFKDSGCLYLFSTGTNYPHEKLLTPYHIYTIQYHYGDFSESALEYRFF